MIKTALLVTIIGLRLVYQPGWPSQDPAPFTSQPPASSSNNREIPTRSFDFSTKLHNNKVWLEWMTGEKALAGNQQMQNRIRLIRNYNNTSNSSIPVPGTGV
jgi:hypothetical protein